MTTLILLFKTTRPSQWVKNLFVVAPVIFAKTHTEQDPFLILRAAAAAIVFVLLSGLVYILNDILDALRDRLHPVKRLRPIASGALPVRTAAAGACFLLVIALIGAWFLGLSFLAIAILYLALNVAYSIGLKKMAYLDVVLIAAGFLLRILAGCFAIGLKVAEVSYFLVACTFLVALFLALGKRRAEIVTPNGVEYRAALNRYRREHLDAALFIVGLFTIATYAIYTLSPRTVAYFGTYRLAWTIPFVAIGLARFWQITISVTGGRSPTEHMVRDWWFWLNIASWAAVVFWAIYGGPS